MTRPLEAQGLPYAIRGAVAYGYWGVPRATVDVDLNLFVEGEDLRQAIAALCLGGAEIDEASALASSQTRGDFRGRVSGMRLDVFTPSIEFSDEAERFSNAAILRSRPTAQSPSVAEPVDSGYQQDSAIERENEIDSDSALSSERSRFQLSTGL